MKKNYIFNETGNIMIITEDNIPQDVKDSYAKISVFFDAMLKTISSTINPKTNKPYSLFNYSALKNVIDESQLFIHVAQEDIEFNSDNFGTRFSNEFVATILGIDFEADSLAFAQSMVTGMGEKCADFLKNNSEDKVANIFFVCEYLLGMTVNSAIVVYLDPKPNIESINLSPCTSKNTHQSKWKLHKDTYMFVTPDES